MIRPVHFLRLQEKIHAVRRIRGGGGGWGGENVSVKENRERGGGRITRILE